jgi:maltodextrin utilization protein YvdJ
VKPIEQVYFAVMFVILAAMMFGWWQHSLAAGFFLFSLLMIPVVMIGLRSE